MLEMGLNLENCERWLERAVLAFVAVMVVVIVIRLHFLLAVASFYSHLTRTQHTTNHSRSHSHSRFQDYPTQRIFVLPPSLGSPHRNDDVELVYAPVPLSSLPKDFRSNATEAWLSHSNPRVGASKHVRTLSESTAYCPSDQQDQEHQRQHSHHRRHSHGHCSHRRSSRSSSSTRTGRICLPLLPDEGLLPSYYDNADTKA